MDTRSLVQTVAAVVVLSILVRWIPLDAQAAATDPLGRGMPLLQLERDAAVAALREQGPDGADAARAFLRPAQLPGVSRRQAQAVRRHWLERAAEVRERARTEPELFAQARGLVRNDFWLLAYDLYPVPLVGTWFEDGGRADDPAIEGAVVFEYRTR